MPLGVINAALKNNLIDQPGGSIKSREGDIRLRGKGVQSDPESIKEIVLRTNDNGGDTNTKTTRPLQLPVRQSSKTS